MPGDNCSILGCGTCRRTKGVGIFKIPKSKPDKKEHEEWRKKWLSCVTRTRELDSSFKQQINNDSVFACERHFDPKDIEVFVGPKMTKKMLKFGALPSMNMPIKSHDTKISPRQAPACRIKVMGEEKVTRFCYSSLNELKKRIKSLKIYDKWSITENENVVYVTYKDNGDYILPRYKVSIDESLAFYILVYGWYLPDTHILYCKYKRSMRNVTVSDLLNEITIQVLCNGHSILSENSNFILHTIPLVHDETNSEDVSVPFKSKIYRRHIDCYVLIDSTSSCCFFCCSFEKQFKSAMNLKSIKSNQPAKLNVPISSTSKGRLKATIQQYRLKCNQFEIELERLRSSIENTSVFIDTDLSTDFTNIMSSANDKEITPFMNVMWQEQKKLFKVSKNGARYLPMLIRFCLSLACKSPSCYKELRDSGILVLPSLRTLRDYKNYIRPQTGFCPNIVEELAEKAKAFSELEKYIVILMDEMTIKANLVYERNTQQLIGFVDLGDPEVNFSTLDDTNEIATHALVFMLRGIRGRFKYCFAYFATVNVTAVQLFVLFWDAVCILENSCKLFVVGVVGDGATCNHGMFRMHKCMDDSNKQVVYRTINLYAKERYIYFVSDVPHLLKTVRNCLLHSSYGKSSRYMWNNGKYLVWDHIKSSYERDAQNGLKLLPKLTQEHIYLSPFSLMTVKFAAQVLSKTMSVVLTHFDEIDHDDCDSNLETANLCAKMNDFFDIMNIRNLDECIRKRNPNLKPFDDVSDPRFDWLVNDFLKYFSDWKGSINNRPGKFSQNARNRMFISWQSHEGLQITTYSIIEVSKYLLEKGFDYVLTNRFCQDTVEQYFGCQRNIGRYSDNPDLQCFGYGNNAIRIQKYASCYTGNSRGAYDSKVTWVEN